MDDLRPILYLVFFLLAGCNISPDKRDHFLRQGQERLAAGDLNAAAGAFDNVLRIDTVCSAGYLGRARTEKALGDHAAACLAFQQALALEPRRLDIRRGLAASLIDCGRFAEASRHLQILQARAPADPRTEDLLTRIPRDHGPLRTARPLSALTPAAGDDLALPLVIASCSMLLLIFRPGRSRPPAGD